MQIFKQNSSMRSKKFRIGDRVVRICEAKWRYDTVINNIIAISNNQKLKKYLPKHIVCNNNKIEYDYVEGRDLVKNFNIKDNFLYAKMLYNLYVEKVFVADMRRENVIVNKNGIYIIDLDRQPISRKEFLLFHIWEFITLGFLENFK